MLLSLVLVFQTQPLEKEIELTGPIKVKLWLSSNQVDTDITAKLLDKFLSIIVYKIITFFSSLHLVIILSICEICLGL